MAVASGVSPWGWIGITLAIGPVGGYIPPRSAQMPSSRALSAACSRLQRLDRRLALLKRALREKVFGLTRPNEPCPNGPSPRCH